MASLASFLLLSCLLSWHSPASYAHLPIDSTTSTDTIPTSTYYKADFPPNSIKESMNEIDGCWRMNPNWDSNRQALADCAIGFGKAALGGKYGEIYTVTDPSDVLINPKPGTLRYGAIQTKPRWIVLTRTCTLHWKAILLIDKDFQTDPSDAPPGQDPSSNRSFWTVSPLP